MTRVVIDEPTRKKLRDLAEPLEVCDDSGRVLAYLTPANDRSIYAELQPECSEDELARREQEAGGRTLTEILAGLESRS